MAPSKDKDKNEKGKEDDKKMYKDSKSAAILKKIFLVTNHIQLLFGLLIVIFSFVGLSVSPQLATIAVRMLTSGIAIIVQGLISVAFQKICCCCKGLDATCLRMAFLSSFAATFELFLFGGAYLFFENGWIDVTLVTGNKQNSYKLTLDKGGDMESLINRHFIFLRVDAIFCIIGFVIVALNCFFSVIMLNPEQYLKQLSTIQDHIISICASEFIFLGAFFKVLDIYSSSLDKVLVALIVIGVVINVGFIVMTILGCFWKKLKPVFEIITQLIPIAIAIISLVFAIYILANMKQFDTKTTTALRVHCKSENSSQQPENEYNNEIYGYLSEGLLNKEELKSVDNEMKSSTLSEFIQDHLSSNADITQHIHSSSFTELDDNDQTQLSIQETQMGDDIKIKNVDSGADKCKKKFVPNIKSVYGCNLVNITVTGRQKVCDDPVETTVEKMSNFSDSVNKIMVFAFFMIIVYVIVGLIATHLSVCILKIYEKCDDADNKSSKDNGKGKNKKGIEGENKW